MYVGERSGWVRGDVVRDESSLDPADLDDGAAFDALTGGERGRFLRQRGLEGGEGRDAIGGEIAGVGRNRDRGTVA